MTDKTSAPLFVDVMTLKSAATKARAKGDHALAEQLEADAAEIIRDATRNHAALTEPEEYEFEVLQDDMLCAGGSGSSLTFVENEASHYSMMYSQDGPVKVQIYKKQLLESYVVDQSQQKTISNP